jgi:hypothetical protein
MENDQYKKAVEVAEAELGDVETQIAALSQRRAQLQQTISALRTLLGEETDDPKVTENIRIILQAANGLLSASKVLEKLEAMGVSFTGKNPIASVQTILARMARPGGEVIRFSPPGGTLAYKWRSLSGPTRGAITRPPTPPDVSSTMIIDRPGKRIASKPDAGYTNDTSLNTVPSSPNPKAFPDGLGEGLSLAAAGVPYGTFPGGPNQLSESSQEVTKLLESITESQKGAR